MYLKSIYIANGTGICLLLILLYVARARSLRHSLEDRIFSFLAIGVMLGCVAEAFSYTIDGKLFWGARVMNYIANTWLFTANFLLPLCVLVYVDIDLYGDPGRIWRCYKPQMILAGVMLLINIVNLFTPVSFYITPGNVYERRPVGYLYYGVVLYYCLSSLVVTARYEREYGARPFLNIRMFLLPIVVGAALQFMFYGLSLAWLSSAVGLLGLFMMQQNEMAYVDSLTDTYNRQYLNHILSAWISRGRRFAGVMLDVDCFKAINDGYGHSEGDQALRTVTDILKQSRTGKEWVFRFAGDEFVVLMLTDDPHGLDAYLDAVNRRLEDYNRADPPYRLSLSYGISFFDEGDVDTFMKEMDRSMYDMKAAHHDRARALDSEAR